MSVPDAGAPAAGGSGRGSSAQASRVERQRHAALVEAELRGRVDEARAAGADAALRSRARRARRSGPCVSTCIERADDLEAGRLDGDAAEGRQMARCRAEVPRPAQREDTSGTPGRRGGSLPRRVHEPLGIVGSGAIACGLAAVAAQRGATSSCSPARRLGASARASARSPARNASAARPAAGAGQRDDRAGRARRRASVLVEAVAEDLDDQGRRPRAQLDAVSGRDAILGDDDLVAVGRGRSRAGRGAPERFVGLHVFNPVTRMKLVELVFPRGRDAGHARARDSRCATALGKTAVVDPDIPGFVVNRLLFPYLFSAVRLMERDRPERRGRRRAA